MRFLGHGRSSSSGSTLLLRLRLIALLLVLVAPAWGNELAGRVVGILDGDTLVLLTADKAQYRIRLAGIDAPEKRQAFGNTAKKALSDLAFEKSATVQWTKLDRYGRVIGRVTIGATDVNLAMVRLGLAWHYKAYANEQSGTDRALYAAAEDNARANHLGLWRDPYPTPPWEFRHPDLSIRSSARRNAAATN